MVSFNPDDFLSDSGTPAVPLLLSVRSQQLVLAAVTEIQDRGSWVDMDDSDWNDTEKAVSEAMYEIMEEVDPEGETMPDTYLRVDRSSNQAIAANTLTEVIFNSEDYDLAGLYDISSPDGFVVPADYGGLWLIQAQVYLSGNGTKRLTFTLEGKEIAQDLRIETVNAPLSLTALIPMADGDTLRAFIFSTVAANVVGSSTTDFSYMSMARVSDMP